MNPHFFCIIYCSGISGYWHSRGPRTARDSAITATSER